METIGSHFDEIENWNNFRRGSEKAFEKVYDKYFTPLLKYGLQVVSNRDLVKDCIQELFIELWRKKGALSEVMSLKNYLYISLRRKIMKELIKENKFAITELSENYGMEFSLPHEFYMVSEQDSEDIKKRLSKSFQLLTKKQKEAIFLKFYEGMGYDDIAVIMELKTVKYARTLIYRSIDVLKSVITKEKIY